MDRPTWLDSVNEAAARACHAPDAPEARRRLLQTLGRTHPFPLRLVFRGLVVGTRDLETPVVLDGPSPVLVHRVQRFLEVVPEGFTRAAYDLLGGVLVPCERRLHEGSVVTLAVDVQDPSTYHLDPVGMLGEVAAMKVDVAVEA